MTTPQEYAHGCVKRAIKQGTLVRPDTCGRCGSPDKPGRDGRSTIHAHHHDYSQPLVVEWLCAKCHRADTPLARGARSGTAKITEAQALTIQRSPLPTRYWAQKLGLDKRTVRRVRSGETWGWIGEDSK